jgi:phenylpropionate dioxygenase-like ring-hydroxylating dioxygenase large terminal subunit
VLLPLNHWHPVYLSRHLKRQPVAVRLCGRQLVLFRAADGRVGALDDVCPHRRLRLSAGRVVGDRLECNYHGWTFGCDGDGKSPGTPAMTCAAPHYDAVDRHGAIWVKPAGVEAVFPHFPVEGFWHSGTMLHHANAPLELTLDNFTEIEHTPTTHAVFGYRLDRMHEVAVRFDPTESTVHVVNEGPATPLPWWLRWLMGVSKDCRFHDEWTTHFSPVYTVYDHDWSNPGSNTKSRVHWRVLVFFTPVDETHTDVVTFTHVKSHVPVGPHGGVRLFGWLINRMADHELVMDMKLIDKLAELNPHLEGMKLSRFDRTLGLNRERIERIYRGRRPPDNAEGRPVGAPVGQDSNPA